MVGAPPAADEARDDDLPAFAERPWIARWLDDGSSFVLTRILVLRLLGIVYFVAFLSTLLQGPALIGEHGLLPLGDYLHAIETVSGSRAAGFLKAPSLFWLSSSDAMLVGLTVVGMLLAFAVVLGVTNAAVMIALWSLQLSIYDVGQIFWGYGWEIQLLETGILAAVLCPLRTWRPLASPPPVAGIWLLRWLIIRIMLGAGLIKLRGDPCWTELTCLVTHYETQPNPSPLSWLFHQLPTSAHVAGALFNHLVEIVAPLLVLGPRPARRIAGGLFVVFQLVLIASGNLSFLNWLTIVPALACFDDALVLRLVRGLPRRISVRLLAIVEEAGGRPVSRSHRRVALAYAAIVLVLSFGPALNLLSPSQQMNASFDPLHLVNTYGAFGTVSRVRDEIVLEGTADPVPETAQWEEYELPCKPGNPARRPCLVSPYHYRLDWQMWFAAMSSYEEEPWIIELADKLLRGERSIAPLLARDPFAGRAPPRWVRARLWRYELRRWSEREDGWWRRRLLTPGDRIGGAEYLRPVGRGDPELATFLALHRYRARSE